MSDTIACLNQLLTFMNLIIYPKLNVHTGSFKSVPNTNKQNSIPHKSYPKLVEDFSNNIQSSGVLKNSQISAKVISKIL